MTRNEKIKLMFLGGYILIASFLVFLIKPYYFFSLIIVMVPPALVNFFWLEISRKKVLVFSVITTAIFAPPIELASRLSDAWEVQSIFPRLFGEISVENMLFAFINFLWVLSFYEYFINRESNGLISKNFKYLVVLYLFFATVIFSLFHINPSLVTFTYFEVSLVILIIPCIVIFIAKPKMIKKVILPTIFFALVFFIYEVVSLAIGSWWWPGDYLFPLEFAGVIFPIDDVIFWYLLSTPALIGGYDLFMNEEISQ